MMKKLLSVLAIASLSLTGALQTGCVALVAGGAAAGGTAYVMGKLTSTLDDDIDSAKRAVRKSLTELSYSRDTIQEDALEAKYVAKTAQDDTVTIYLEKMDFQNTSITIRVGTFGDENRSILILEKIKSNL